MSRRHGSAPGPRRRPAQDFRVVEALREQREAGVEEERGRDQDDPGDACSLMPLPTARQPGDHAPSANPSSGASGIRLRRSRRCRVPSRLRRRPQPGHRRRSGSHARPEVAISSARYAASSPTQPRSADVRLCCQLIPSRYRPGAEVTPRTCSICPCSFLMPVTSIHEWSTLKPVAQITTSYSPEVPSSKLVPPLIAAVTRGRTVTPRPFTL